MDDIYLGLGSNLGDRRQLLEAARKELHQPPDIRIVEASALYETAPVGGPGNQGLYLNAVLKASSTLSVQQLLARCQEIETLYGRTRTERWGARTLDIDILLYGNEVIEAANLTVPHPRLHLRRFVLVPLCELAPGLVPPLLGRSCRQLLNSLPESDEVNLFAQNW